MDHTYALRDPGGQSCSIVLRAEPLLRELEGIWTGKRGHAALKAVELKLSKAGIRSLLSIRNRLRRLARVDQDSARCEINRRLEQAFAAWLARELTLQQGVQPLSPRRRDRVEQLTLWIDRHLGEPIDLDRLSRIAGVGGHALAKATSVARGRSPMELVLTRRLEAAHRFLLEGQGNTVSDTALACGFSHLGRFAGDYRAAFGELPSDTLARRRAGSPAFECGSE
jgi:AraC-like DNA-binding protein